MAALTRAEVNSARRGRGSIQAVALTAPTLHWPLLSRSERRGLLWIGLVTAYCCLRLAF